MSQLSHSAPSDAGMEDVLSSILAARICHDLVSPVGAIVNFVDLIREVGGGDISEELRLIAQSAERASSLLQFHRIAFGTANKSTEIARTVLRDHAEPVIASAKIMVVWDGLKGPPPSARESRLILLLMLCAKALAGMRGLIRVGLGDDAFTPATITIEGEGARQSEEMLGHLADDRTLDLPEPRMIEFVLARMAAESLGYRIDTETAVDRLTLTVTG